MLTNNTVYRVLPVQIPQFWNAIKFACVQADELDKEDFPDYFNELLQALLSDKAQCFVALDNSKVLHSIAITRISVNRIKRTKELCIQCMYSMSAIDNASLIRYFSFIAQFARQEECTSIMYNSRNPRVWQIAGVVGCTEQYRSFIFNLIGGK